MSEITEGNGAKLIMLRGEAINSYSGLEIALLQSMISFGDIKRDVASIIFYKITNTGARNAIVDRLKKRAWKDKYNLFWNSLMKGIGQLDNERNVIVHWHMRLVERPRGPGEYKQIADLELSHPNLFSGAEVRTEDDLKKFIVHCRAFSAAAHLLIGALYTGTGIAERSPFREILRAATNLSASIWASVIPDFLSTGQPACIISSVTSISSRFSTSVSGLQRRLLPGQANVRADRRPLPDMTEVAVSDDAARAANVWHGVARLHAPNQARP